MDMTPLHVISINSGPWGSAKMKEFELNTPGSSADHARFLIRNRAKTDAKGMIAEEEIALSCKIYLVPLTCAIIDMNGATPLHLAAMVGASSVVDGDRQTHVLFEA